MTYRSAKHLGILPEEREALIAFVKAPALGRIVSVNGHAHYYDQEHASDKDQAKENECGTAGCVAGFVFAHVSTVQGKRHLRGARNADQYIDKATHTDKTDSIADYYWEDDDGKPDIPVLHELYTMGGEWKLSTTRRVVDGLLRLGKVRWPK